MTAYIYLLNGRIHTVENCVNIVHNALDDSITFSQNNPIFTHRNSTIKYLEKDVANVSLQL